MRQGAIDLIVIGGGPAGLLAAITAARRGRRVMLLERLPRPGAKLLASGGGRCNLTNTLPLAAFQERFGKTGPFLGPALAAFDQAALVEFLAALGVPCHAPDGFHVFPVSHRASDVLEALLAETARLGITILAGRRVDRLQVLTASSNERSAAGRDAPPAAQAGPRNRRADSPPGLASRPEGGLPACRQEAGARFLVGAGAAHWLASQVVLATGGKGFPDLGTEGDGYALAAALGHTIATPFPAMLPLQVREPWVGRCRADTIGKAVVRLARSPGRPVQATGDLIFTADGIRGPVVLDLAREITPRLATEGEVPIEINLTQGRNEEEVRGIIEAARRRRPEATWLDLLEELVPRPLGRELCALAGVDPGWRYRQTPGAARDRLLKRLVWTPLTVIGHGGFAQAMVTRGGVRLTEVDPATLASRLVPGLFFAGEVLDVDGPCGGFNLQWAFSSGFLAGHLGDSPARTRWPG